MVNRIKIVMLVEAMILAFVILLVDILTNRFSYYSGDNIFIEFPLLAWILILLIPCIGGYIIWTSKNENKKTTIFIPVGLIYVLLLYSLNIYFIIPYRQVETTSIPLAIKLLVKYPHINKDLAGIYSYPVSYPLFFIMARFIMLISEVGATTLYTLFFIIFLVIFYFILLSYYSTDEDMFSSVLAVLGYTVLSFYVINFQFAPQTFSLMYLPLLYKITTSTLHSNSIAKNMVLLFILWTSLILTHPFMFIFYILPTSFLLGYLYINKSSYTSKFGIAIFTLWGSYLAGFVYIYYLKLRVPLVLFFRTIGRSMGETWLVIRWFLRTMSSPQAPKVFPHYDMVPRFFNAFQATGVRLILITLLLLVIYGIFKEVITDKRTLQFVYDILVLISSVILFLVGLFTIFLGQRALQVFMMPISRYIKNLKAYKRLLLMLIIILIVTPFMYTLNVLISLSVGPQLFVQDTYLVTSGLFGEMNFPDACNISVVREIYPTVYPNRHKFEFSTDFYPKANSNWDYLYWSPKFTHVARYFGIYDEYKKEQMVSNWIYNNYIVTILSG
ncbi:hypothetical protein [Palaeococcus ferrophilus]|uniref:hypothetical protein n=1 Tax=Palaeococcus ferrophilus TaxID=83868 RepID=UPI00064E8CD8|nr:hypothetical protein [Palaeococcus ferrophilus]